MTSKQLLSKLKHDKAYKEYIESLESDLKILEIIKKNAKFSGRFAKECDKDGNLTGVFSILEVILTGRNAITVERWLENDK